MKDNKGTNLEVFDLNSNVNVSEVEGRTKKGISSLLLMLIVETLYIFLVEIGFKSIFGASLLDWSTLRLFTSSALFALILALITSPMKTIFRRIIVILVNLFIVVYAWLQLGFMDFLGTFISMGSAEQGTKITDYIGDFLLSINIKDYFLFILFIIFIIYIIFEKKITKSQFKDRIPLKNYKTYLSMLLCMFGFIILFILTLNLNFMQNKYQTISNKALFKNATNPSLTIKNFGTTMYFLLDLKGTMLGISEDAEYVPIDQTQDNPREVNDNSRHIDDSIWKMVMEEEKDSSMTKLNQYFYNRNITDKNEYTGIFEGKNLIVVMLESVGSAVFDEQYSEYFPTLYKMYTEGITAVNHYSPRNNCATGESEMTSSISLYSLETTCTVNTYKKNVYPEALLSMFKGIDYYTSAFHDYTEQYYTRSIFEKNFGAIDFYGVKELKMSYNPAYIEWPSDVTFIEKALPKFIEKEHFASYLVSVTGHSPYMYSSEFGNKYVSLFKDLKIDTTTKRYLSKMKVVDLALEKMLQLLDEAGKLEDTVIVLFGDHYPYALSSKEYNSITSWDSTVNQEMDKTPLVIYNSGTDAKVITKYATPLDITPTLLNMFGLDYDPRFYMGNDLLSEYDDYAIFPDNSWQSSVGFYNASKGVFTPSKEETDGFYDEYIISMNELVTELRNMSVLAIKKNYFKNLFDKIEAKKQELIKIEENEISDNEND